jgi:hypothetical protein
VNLSENFTLEEMTHTGTGLPNQALGPIVANLQRLCGEFLEPLRAVAGPLHVNSGFRCPAVNSEVGGAGNSAHLSGRAADIVSSSHTAEQLFNLARNLGLPYDQLIWEPTWVHIGIAAEGVEPRQECLKATRVNGKMHYAGV